VTPYHQSKEAFKILGISNTKEVNIFEQRLFLAVHWYWHRIGRIGDEYSDVVLVLIEWSKILELFSLKKLLKSIPVKKILKLVKDMVRRIISHMINFNKSSRTHFKLWQMQLRFTFSTRHPRFLQRRRNQVRPPRNPSQARPCPPSPR